MCIRDRIEAFYKKSEKFNVSLNYNYTDTYDGADCDDPNVGSTSCIDESMVRVPRHSSNVNLSYKTKNNLKNILSLKYNGEVRDYGNGNNSFADVILDEYLAPTLQVSYDREYYADLDGMRITIDQNIQYYGLCLHLSLIHI